MVCNGYAMATFYLCNKAGVETRFIRGIGGNDTKVNHAWNAVKIDGKWYNIDVTWDDKGGFGISYEYFLKSDADFPLHIRSGRYNNIEISKTSYKAASSKQYLLWIFVFIMTYIIIITIIKKRSKAKPVVTSVVTSVVNNDGFDEWMKENESTDNNVLEQTIYYQNIDQNN